ncbi:MAG TPA: hypothetical protein VF398_08430 [bacterium]|jgi:hypothetical protein
MGRYAIILVAGMAVLLGVAKLRLNRIGLSAAELSVAHYENLTSLNLANSGAHLGLMRLRQEPSWRTGYTNLNLDRGFVDVDILDSVSDSTLGEDTIRVVSRGTCGQTTSRVSILAALNPLDWPANVDAGITAQCDVETLGNMVIDGRDHDLDGNLIADNGESAVSTTQTYTRGGNSKVGGTTDAPMDIVPAKTGWEPVVEEGKIWPEGYPLTPDQVMGGSGQGFSEGALKALAQSGLGGSQYVTQPWDLQFPLQGITYLEMSSGSSWNPVSFGSLGSGLLIVHNSASNSVMKNLNFGTFKGLIIADDMVHIHTPIIGAVFLLTAAPSSGNCIGNGSGSLLFSRESVNRAIGDAGIAGGNLSLIEYWE